MMEVAKADSRPRKVQRTAAGAGASEGDRTQAPKPHLTLPEPESRGAWLSRGPRRVVCFCGYVLYNTH